MSNRRCLDCPSEEPPTPEGWQRTRESVPEHRFARSGLWLLGFATGLPISTQIFGDREFFPLQLVVMLIAFFAFFDASRLLAGARTRLGQTMCAIAIWMVASIALNYKQDLTAGTDHFLLPRAISVAASGGYMILPFLVGVVAIRSKHDMREFVLGFLAASVVAATLYVGQFAYHAMFAHLETPRLLIGQRVPLVLCAAFFVLAFTSKARLPLYAAMLLLLCTTILLSETRVMAAVIVPASAICCLLIWRLGRPSRSIALAACIISAAIIAHNATSLTLRFQWLSPGAVSVPTQPVDYDHYLESIDAPLTRAAFARGVTDESLVTRLLIWDSLIEKLTNGTTSLLAGFGQLGPAFVGDTRLSPNGLIVSRYSAHNEYLDQAVRGGLIGLTLFLIFCFFLVRCLLTVGRQDEYLESLGWGLAITLLAASGYGMFHETVRYPFFGNLFWFLAGSYVGLGIRGARQNTASTDPRPLVAD